MKRLMIPCIYLRDDVNGEDGKKALQDALCYRDKGADALMIFDHSKGDSAHERAISQIKVIAGEAEVPVMAGGNIHRLEDVKKLIYAGCAYVIVDMSMEKSAELLEEASKRFGREKMIAAFTGESDLAACRQTTEEAASQILLFEASAAELSAISAATSLPVIIFTSKTPEQAVPLLKADNVSGITGILFRDPAADIVSLKEAFKKEGIDVMIYESSIAWKDFKLNGDGLIPVIVQDYKTDEVLMLAYMNEDAFNITVRSGRMTYWSRSRNELWVKGLTSGHFQYVKELRLDCDNDTILAKVDQIGAACHTGSRSCFFQTLLKKEYDDTNPLRVFQDVYDVIMDRKANPKEGSYTNYLFDKGIDKILKKVGEECTEIVIAAKNPDKEEIKYEISDFLYHVMVLMAEKGVTWDEITRELARR